MLYNTNYECCSWVANPIQRHSYHLAKVYCAYVLPIFHRFFGNVSISVVLNDKSTSGSHSFVVLHQPYHSLNSCSTTRSYFVANFLRVTQQNKRHRRTIVLNYIVNNNHYMLHEHIYLQFDNKSRQSSGFPMKAWLLPYANNNINNSQPDWNEWHNDFSYGFHSGKWELFVWEKNIREIIVIKMSK